MGDYIVCTSCTSLVSLPRSISALASNDQWHCTKNIVRQARSMSLPWRLTFTFMRLHCEHIFTPPMAVMGCVKTMLRILYLWIHCIVEQDSQPAASYARRRLDKDLLETRELVVSYRAVVEAGAPRELHHGTSRRLESTSSSTLESGSMGTMQLLVRLSWMPYGRSRWFAVTCSCPARSDRIATAKRCKGGHQPRLSLLHCRRHAAHALYDPWPSRYFVNVEEGLDYVQRPLAQGTAIDMHMTAFR